MTKIFEEDNPLALVIHKLNVSRYATSSIDAASADRICQDASAIFGQCRVQVIRNGAIAIFTAGNGTINSQADFQAVCGAGLAGISEEQGTLGLTKKVHVINQINWCGVIKPNII